MDWYWYVLIVVLVIAILPDPIGGLIGYFVEKKVNDWEEIGSDISEERRRRKE